LRHSSPHSSKSIPKDYWDFSQNPEEIPIHSNLPSLPASLSELTERPDTEETSETLHRALQDTSIRRHTLPERVHQHKHRLLDRYDEFGNELPDIPRDTRDTPNDEQEDCNLERFYNKNPSYPRPPWFAPRQLPDETIPEY
jgi:hypothetical protein